MRLLATGANGFVGRAFCAEAVRQGHELRALVREAARGTGLPGEVVETRDLQSADWRSILSGVDVIVHLAARVHVMKETAADPLAEFRAVNVDMTVALATAAAAHGAKRFVYVSSIKVNGEQTRERAFTADDPPAPQDAYGRAKCEAEHALQRIADKTGLEVTIVRPPLVYGPGVRGNFLRLLKLVDRGMPLPFAGVENRRSLVYSRNLASALVACSQHPAAAGRTYLVNDGEDVSTEDLVRRMAAALRTSVRCFNVPETLLRLVGRCTGTSAEIQRLFSSLTVDASRIRSELGWSAPCTLAEGLAETARWYRAGR